MNKLCKGYLIPNVVDRLDNLERLLGDDDKKTNPYWLLRELRLEIMFLREVLKILGYATPVHPSQVTIDEVCNESVLTD